MEGGGRWERGMSGGGREVGEGDNLTSVQYHSSNNLFISGCSCVVERVVQSLGSANSKTFH